MKPKNKKNNKIKKSKGKIKLREVEKEKRNVTNFNLVKKTEIEKGKKISRLDIVNSGKKQQINNHEKNHKKIEQKKDEFQEALEKKEIVAKEILKKPEYTVYVFDDYDTLDIDSIVFEKKKLPLKIRQRLKLVYFLEKAGLEKDPKNVKKSVTIVAYLITLFLSFILIYFLYSISFFWYIILFYYVLWWVIAFPALLWLSWLVYYIYLDFKIFKRRVEIEEVLPEYLQIVANNMKAGMPIDQALWYAVKPRFGVLAKEIELVAKETLTGQELSKALKDFARKYDSLVLKRSIALLIEGIEAGGNIADLFDKIAIDIQETRILRKDMAANVLSYTIFITMSVTIIAPLLFALSQTLLSVVQKIVPQVQTGTALATGVPFQLFSSTVSIRDFQIFSVIYLTITSVFSAMIISMIRKGNVRYEARKIPVFIIFTLLFYLLASFLLSKLMGGVI